MVKKLFWSVFAALLCGPTSFPAFADDLEKDLYRDIRESKNIVVKAIVKLTSGDSPTAEVARIKQVGESIRAAHILMQERFKLRQQQTSALGSKSAERQESVTSGYLKALEEYLALIDAIPPDGTVGQAMLDSIARLIDSIAPPRKRPLLGALPYKHLNSPPREPATAPVVVPAYRGGDRTVTPADTAATVEAPISTEIAELAKSLNWNPVLIYEWVKNNVQTEWYWGAMKGAEETLRQKSGNDADQAALLTALLRSAGFPTRYVRGVIEFFPDINKVKSLTGINDPVQIAAFFQKSGIPFKPVIAGGGIANFQIEHIWVESEIPYSNYRGAIIDDFGKTWLALDTGIKPPGLAWNAPIDLPGFSFDTLRNDYLQSVQTATPLEFVKAKVEEYLSQNNPGKGYQDLFSTKAIIPDILKILPASLQFKQVAITGEYAELPAELRHQVKFTATGPVNTELFTITLDALRLSNQRVTLSYEPETVEDQQIIDSFGGLDNTPSYLVRLRPVLKVRGERLVVAQDGLPMGTDYTLTIEVITPNGTERISNTHIVGNLAVIGVVAQQALPAAPISDQDDAETILFKETNGYIDRWNRAEDELASLLKVAVARPIPTIVTVGGLIDVTYLLDIPHGFEWKGVFMDAALRGIETVTRTSDGSREKTFMGLSALQGSILENRVFEDGFKVDSISTAKLLQFAAASGTTLLTIDKANVDAVLSTLGADEDIKTDIANAVNQGLVVTIPQTEVSYRDWTGIGYIKENPETGESGWMLSGMVAGGTTALISSYWDDPVSRMVADRLQFPYAGAPNADPNSAVYIGKISTADRQLDTVGKKLGKPLQAMVLDGQKKPVKGVDVTFTVIAGGGTLMGDADTITVKTDQRGIASADYTLGKYTAANPTYWLETGNTFSTQIGENLIHASLPTGETIATPFVAYGFPDAAHHIKRKNSGTWTDNVLSFAGSAIVVVEDQYGNPAANRSVIFEVTDPTGVGACYSVAAAKPASLITASDPCLSKIPLYGECSTTPLLSSTQLTGSDGAAAVGVLLGGIPGASYSIRATDNGIAVSTDPTIIKSISIPYATFPFGNPCGMANDPANWLTATYTFPVDVNGNNIDAAKVGTTIPLLARTYAVLEGAVTVTVNGTCGIVCDKIAGSRTFLNFTDFIASSVAFTGPDNIPIAGILQDPAAKNGIYTGSYTLKPGLNTIAVKAEARMKRDRTEVCPSCTKISDEEFSLAAETNIVVYGVDITIIPSVQIETDSKGYSISNAVVSYTITPAEYQAGTANVVIYESKEGKPFQPVLYIPAENKGEGFATIVRGFPFDLKNTYKAEVVLNYGSGVEIRSSEIPINLIGGNVPLERQHLLSQFDSTIPTTIGSAYTDSYKTFSVTLPQPSSVTVSVLDSGFSNLGAIVPATQLQAGEYSFVVDYGQIRKVGIDPSVSQAFYLQVLQTSPDNPPHKTIYRGRMTERSRGKMLGQTIVHDVLLQDGSLNLSRQDFAFKGRGQQLTFTRSYNNQSSPYGPKPLGEGWSHSLDMQLQPISSQASGVGPVPDWVANLKGKFLNPGDIPQTPQAWTVVSVNGATFKKVNNVWYAERGRHGSLMEENGSFIFTSKDGTRYKYDYPLKEATPVRTIEDRNGNVMTFAYDALGRLSTTTDAVGRSCTFRYDTLHNIYSDDNSRLTAVTCSGGIELQLSYNPEGYLQSAQRGAKIETYDYAREPGIVKADYNLVKATDSNNHSHQYEYHGPGEVHPNLVTFLKYFRSQDVIKKVTYPNNAAVSFRYDVLSGNRRAVTDLSGNDTIYTLNYHGNPQKIEEPLGKTTFMTWSIDEGKNDNVMTSKTDGRGNRTLYEYDVAGNVTKETDPYNNSIITVWNQKYSLPESHIDRNMVTHGWQYDLKGNLIKETDGDGKQTGHTYYSTGERQTTTDPRCNTTAYTYDQWGNPATVTESEGSATKYENDIRGRRTALIDPNNRRTDYTYDALDYPTTIVSPAFASYSLPTGSTNIKTYGYDAAGNLLKETDRVGLTLTYTYTERDQVKTITRSTGGTKTFSYDNNGNLTSETDWKGIAASHTYDKLNRRTGSTNRLGHVKSMGYDLNGNPTSETDYEGRTTSHEYDKLNRLTKTVQPALPDQQPGELVYTYFNEAYSKTNLKTETDQEGNTSTYEYNGRYLRSKRTNANNDTYTWEYDDSGNLSKEINEAGNYTRYQYDRQNHRTATFRQLGAGELKTAYSYDPAGNCIHIIDPRGNDTETSYDEWNRIWKVTDPDSYVTTTELDGEGREIKTIDGNGNTRTRQRDKRGFVLTSTDAEGKSTTYTYDVNGNVETVTDANYVVTRTAYDAEERKTTTTEAEGTSDERTTATVNRDKLGNPLQVRDYNGNITTTEYNALNLPSKVTDAKGKSTETAYYRTGKIKSVTDRRSHTTSYEYDKLNRLTKATDPLTQTIETTYDKVGNVKIVKDKRGIISENFYDELNRLMRKDRADARLVTNEYDAAGNLSATIDANNNRTEHSYTKRNQLDTTTFADATTQKHTYDGAGNLITHTDEEDKVTTYAYDKENRQTSTDLAGEKTDKRYDNVGNVVEIVKPKGNSRTMFYDNLRRLKIAVDDSLFTRYEYDGNGNLRHQYDPRGNHVEYTWDELNRKTAHIQHKASGNLITSYGYDEEGNLTTLADAKGQASTYVYDLLNRRTESHYSGLDSTNSYDENNNVTGTSVSGTSSDSATNTYDDFDRLKTSIQRGITVSYTYDSNGNRLSVGTAGDSTIYTYDNRNRVQTATAGTQTTTFDYYNDGKKKTASYPNGAKEEYEYYPTNRVKTLINSINGSTISSFAYIYDKNGNRLSQDETRGARTISTSYMYDTLDRMASYSVTENGATTKTEYTFDGYNRATETVTQNGASTVKSYTYDETDWLTRTIDVNMTVTYSYDANGNTIRKADTSDPGNDIVYEYDVRDKLIKTGKGATILGRYDYNAQGYRIRQQNSDRGDVEYIYDGAAVIEERKAGGLLAHYRYANKLYSLTDGSSSQYYHLDALGSTTDLTDDSGASKASYFLNPWGMIVDSIGNSVNRRVFTGKEIDQNTGLVYFGARYYDPDTARFTTQDSYLGEQGTPPSLHRYLYAYSNPLAYLDPDGHAGYFFDGTGNHPNDANYDGSANYTTNVRKLYEGYGEKYKFYAYGIGSGFQADGTPYEKMWHGGTGRKITYEGITGETMDARVTYMVKNLEKQFAKGDKVVDVYGFSRGGATALEFLNRIQDQKDAGNELYKDVDIRFVGLFDVVPSKRSSLFKYSDEEEVPTGEKNLLGLDKTKTVKYRFDLPENMEFSAQPVHAVSIDEQRKQFATVDLDGALQVGFRGVHSDVGGGYDNNQFDWISRDYMVSKSREAGVNFDEYKLNKYQRNGYEHYSQWSKDKLSTSKSDKKPSDNRKWYYTNNTPRKLPENMLLHPSVEYFKETPKNDIGGYKYLQ